MVFPARVSQARTYSVAPSPVQLPNETTSPSQAQLDLFLEGENPIGCIRGVMWVMAFNFAVFLFGAAIWECVKFLR